MTRKRFIKEDSQPASKRKILFWAPVEDISGYAVMSRAIIRTFEDAGFELAIAPQKWSSPSFAFFSAEDRDALDEKIGRTREDCGLVFQMGLPTQFRNFRISVPTIGYTTLEAFPWCHDWVVGCNRMSTLYVLSEFDRTNAYSSGVSCPVEIVVPQNPFLKETEESKISDFKLKVPTEFNFLCIGQMTKYDRKNIRKLIRLFLAAFQGNKEVGLIVKTYMRDNSLIDYAETVASLARECYKREYPKVYLVHGTFPESSMSMFYDNADAYICLSKAEGLCLPVLEAVRRKIPVVAPYYSGYTTYLKKEYSPFVDYRMVKVDFDWPGVFGRHQSWCDPIEESVVETMRSLVRGEGDYSNLVESQARYLERIWETHQFKGFPEELFKKE